MEQTSPEVMLQALKLAAQVMTQEMKARIEQIVRESVENVVQEALNNCDFVRTDAVEQMIENSDFVTQDTLDELERTLERTDFVESDDLEGLVQEAIERGDIEITGTIDEVVTQWFQNNQFRLTPL